ncbi:MAG: hypothetical protein IPG50_23535 [Myxococcales bacterium]|nr:hypothetical protein [Myxococcales bacterium]
MRSSARFALVLLTLAACAPANDDSTAESEGALGATGTSGGAATLPNAIHWVRNSAEYRAAVRQAYRLAAANVASELARTKLAPGTWGVVLDADETVVDNSAYNMERAFSPEGSTSSSWDTYVKSGTGKAIPAAMPFLEEVKRAGGRVFIVTNRSEAHCAATQDNLRRIGVSFDAILCKGTFESDKNGRFRAIEEGKAPSPLPATKVLVYVGDNVMDFPGLDQAARDREESLKEFGGRFILIPNPMYGSWEKNERR